MNIFFFWCLHTKCFVLYNCLKLQFMRSCQFFRCMFLAIELPHVLELDFSSIKDRFIVLQCGLSGTIVFSN